MYENEIYSGSESTNRSGDSAGYTTYPTDSFNNAGNGGNNTGNDVHKKKGGAFRKVVLSTSLGLCFGLFAGIGFYAVQLGTGQLNRQEAAEEGAEPEIISNVVTYPGSDYFISPAQNIAYMVSSDISDVVEEVMPAMVSIVNSYVQEGTNIFGQTYSRSGASGGSGIIVAENDDELLIVSNNHVVEGADSLTVTFIDGSEAKAVIKGLDADNDLAVIAVPIKELTSETRAAICVATLGDSDDLKLGVPVIAIGNALGYGQSVTNGIVSALDREVTLSDGTTHTYIQTNAAINPGNSGGALLNMNGEVIGINSSKIGSAVVEGMGYAIPITSASPIIAELMERQTRTVEVDESEMGYLGITMQYITDEISKVYGIPQGVFVYSVESGSAADKGGLTYGDIIVGFDGQKIASPTELQETIRYYAAGETVTVKVQRVENGKYEPYELEITLGKKS